VSSGAPASTRRHPEHLGGGGAQFWVASVLAKKAEWGKRSAAPLDRPEREQGEGGPAWCATQRRRGGGESDSEAHDGRGGPGGRQDPGAAAPGRAARARAQQKQVRRREKWVANMWA
jgi:hypothetical protein